MSHYLISEQTFKALQNELIKFELNLQEIERQCVLWSDLLSQATPEEPFTVQPISE